MNRFHKSAICALMMIGASVNAFANFLVVTPEQVSVTSEGLFVSIDGLPTAVESLTMVNDGYIVAIPSLQAAVCPKCRRDTYTPGRTCSTCGFPIWNKKSS